MKKKGQLTIFIIIGIILIAVIVLFFIFRGTIKIPGIGGGKETSSQSFLESCLEDAIKEGTETLALQGGYLEPTIYKNFKFKGEEARDISYLCYTPNYYIPCVNQEPLLIKHLKNELYDYIADDVRSCFDSLTSSLDKQGYSVNSNYRGFDIELNDNKIIVDIDAELDLTRAGETTKQTDFEIDIASKFYDLALVVQEIVNQEAEYCNFEYLGYMAFYPQWYIEKTGASDSTIIYTVENKKSKERFRFAIRGCAI